MEKNGIPSRAKEAMSILPRATNWRWSFSAICINGLGMSPTKESSQGRGCTISIAFSWKCGLESEEDFTLDPRVITERALAGKSRACTRALDWFISLYASEAGNLALKLLAVGGVYLGGGIVPKILPFFKAESL